MDREKYAYTYGDPTYYTLKSAIAVARSKVPSRERGRSGRFLVGGYHMTHYGYLPMQLVKRATCTDCGGLQAIILNRWSEYIKSGRVREMEVALAKVPSKFASRIIPVERLDENNKRAVVYPWLYACNRLRFPMWDGMHDTRLD